MELNNAIFQRRTIRRFKQIKIEDSVIGELIDAARVAPCGGNSQQLGYIVIRTPEKAGRIFEITAWGGHVKPHRNPVPEKSAPTAFIAVIAGKTDSKVVHADAGAAIQNVLLKAVELGLGACWIGSFHKEKASEILQLDESISVLYLVALGYPDEKPVMENINQGDSTKYYLDKDDVIHVPKYSIDAITQWY
ncbi:MAG: hypothetical protein A2017_03240 [Lentisphaerae bacterium GWF2_44_16]|nr:MAG: hypothetical protein A2017_03240 [Lentisphaerae bacterium GWF2_44_16]